MSTLLDSIIQINEDNAMNDMFGDGTSELELQLEDILASEEDMDDGEFTETLEQFMTMLEAMDTNDDDDEYTEESETSEGRRNIFGNLAANYVGNVVFDAGTKVFFQSHEKHLMGMRKRIVKYEEKVMKRFDKLEAKGIREVEFNARRVWMLSFVKGGWTTDFDKTAGETVAVANYLYNTYLPALTSNAAKITDILSGVRSGGDARDAAAKAMQVPGPVDSFDKKWLGEYRYANSTSINIIETKGVERIAIESVTSSLKESVKDLKDVKKLKAGFFTSKTPYIKMNRSDAKRYVSDAIGIIDASINNHKRMEKEFMRLSKLGAKLAKKTAGDLSGEEASDIKRAGAALAKNAKAFKRTFKETASLSRDLATGAYQVVLALKSGKKIKA